MTNVLNLFKDTDISVNVTAQKKNSCCYSDAEPTNAKQLFFLNNQYAGEL
jgi:hypothetical protein